MKRLNLHFLSIRGARTTIAALGCAALLSSCFTTNAGPPGPYGAPAPQRVDYQTDNTGLYVLGATAAVIGASYLYNQNRSRGPSYRSSQGHHHHHHHYPHRRSSTSIHASFSQGYGYSPGYYGYPVYSPYYYYY